ncbi:MAG: DoxX-like family protein [Burkholderiales bacterium]|nr:DoxX-like family protein [Burkholderiales bacterium]
MPTPHSPRQRAALEWARWSLVIVWIGSGVTSLWGRHNQSIQLLQGTLLTDPWLQQVAIWAGSALDLGIGLGMALWPRQRMFDAALAAMILLTVVATWLNPSLWLHPLGPLLKNIPIAAMLWQLREHAQKQSQESAS